MPYMSSTALVFTYIGFISEQWSECHHNKVLTSHPVPRPALVYKLRASTKRKRQNLLKKVTYCKILSQFSPKAPAAIYQKSLYIYIGGRNVGHYWILVQNYLIPEAPNFTLECSGSLGMVPHKKPKRKNITLFEEWKRLEPHYRSKR